MSTKEVRRAAVFAQVKEGRVLLAVAARQLGVSYRQAKRLYARYKTRGHAGLRHGNVGRRSNRAWPAAEEQAVVALIRQHYGGAREGRGQRFGPTLVAEHLWTDHGRVVPVPTLRRWMLRAGLWDRLRRARPTHVRRPRRLAFGELLQLDGSFHDWFEARGPRPCLMSLVDDATGTLLARFAAEETTWAAVAVLEAWIREHGVPQALYTDAKTVYVREPTSQELAAGYPARTQFGQMCARLGIELITARSPQAKGRIERNHGTNQDRLVKKLRLQGIASIAAANEFLVGSYLADHNARFAQSSGTGVNAHTPAPRALAEIFALEETRQLGNDWVVRYHNRALQVTPTRAARRHAAPGRRVLVRETEAGVVRILVRDPSTGREHELAWTPTALTPKTGRFSAAPAPPPTAAEPAGYTRAGKPLSAKQMALRNRWAKQDAAEIQRRRTWASLNGTRAPRLTREPDTLHSPGQAV
jgi:transposase